MKILYLDCPTGISGDMCMASLIDMGVDLAKIEGELKKLRVDGYTIKTSREKRHAITGTRFKVSTVESRHRRTFKDIKDLIWGSTLPSRVKELSISMFKNLAIAEGKVHGISHLKVHFHEVGAIDSIVDIVGVAIALNELKVDKVYASPIPLGRGWVNTDHGRLPVPAPATLEVIKGVPVVPSDIEMELTTPTGAVIVKTLASGFGQIPAMTVEKIGYGVGGKDLKELPNAMRAVLGRADGGGQRLTVMETNIDDMNPQICGYLMERLLGEGALDVYFTPVQMKKSRPGTLLTVLAYDKDRDRLMEIMFKESTSIGVRYHTVERRCLERRTIKVKTPYGTVRVKQSLLDDLVVNVQPEYEDCRVIAEKKKVPVKEVIDAAKKALEQ